MTQLSDLQTQIRYLTNTENSQFITNTELTYYINASAGELDDILLTKNEDYRLTHTQLVIATGSTFPLPSDFYQLRGVDFYTNSAPTPWLTLKQFSMPERNKYTQPFFATIPGTITPYYMLQDGYVAIIPPVAALGTYQLWYTPILPALVNQTDTIPSYLNNNAWCEYIVVDCCIKVLNKQNLDPSAFMAQKAGLKVRVEGLAGKRDAGAPKCGRQTRFSGSSRYGGYMGWRV